MRQSASAVSTAPTTTSRGDGHERLGEDQAVVVEQDGLVALGRDRLLARGDDRVGELLGHLAADAVGGHEGVGAGVVAVDHGHAGGALGRASPSPRSARPRPRSRRRRRGRRPRPRRWRCRRTASFGGPPCEHALGLARRRRPRRSRPRRSPAISPREPDRELGAERPRSRAARAHDRGERDFVAARAPEVCCAERVVVHALYAAAYRARGERGPSSISSSTSASVSSARRLWPGRKSSTYGSAACMPATSGR